ncbi:MAG: hypothetical protein M3132_13695 [Actinomycetia bacterium]|nr:hypothetical protein [Actinomycetes bacterium]
MANTTSQEYEDWVIPSILVGVVVVILLGLLAFVSIRDASSDDTSVAGQLETWSRCLRSEGAPVPLVESLNDGGFRITVDASVLESDSGFDSVLSALAACVDESPDKVQDVIEKMSAFDELFSMQSDHRSTV